MNGKTMAGMRHAEGVAAIQTDAKYVAQAVWHGAAKFGCHPNAPYTAGFSTDSTRLDKLIWTQSTSTRLRHMTT